MGHARIPSIVYVLACISCGIPDTVHYARSNVDVLSVTSYDCVSNCSHNSTGSNKLVSCFVEECGDLPELNITAQGLDDEGVHFEIFTNLEGQIRLALVIKWSPIDNASIKYTKGYLVNISDGETSYLKCYSIGTTLSSLNKKDKFYNDCFGKESGTLVKPASTITAEITPLPLAENGLGSRRNTVTVEVPDCTNSKLHTMEECQIPGGVPSSQPCEENCNTFSTVNGIANPIECSISKKTFLQHLETCPALNRTVEDGNASPPKHKKKEQEWYKFFDSDEVKIALNFSFGPQGDSSIRSLRGYHINVTPTGSGTQLSFNKCFSIHTKMDGTKHVKATFFFDCYGRQSLSEVRPGRTYRVTIQSVGNDEHTYFDISIPSCADEKLQDVTECMNDNRVLTSKVEEIYCNNRSVRYSYKVTPEFGKSAAVRFCEKGIEPNVCKNTIIVLDSLKLSGTLYNLSLVSTANLSIPYVIGVFGDDYPSIHYSYPNFTSCVVAEPVLTSTVEIALICVAVVIAVALAVFLIWFFLFRDKCGFWKFKKYRPPPPEIYVTLPLSPDITAPADLPDKVCAYVVFAEDHELHKRVVHWFCSYLKRDLSIDVKIHIWEENIAATNRPEYMTKNLQLADRVIVICSEGTRNALDSNHDTLDNMYAPVMRRIVADALASKNPEKYMVAHFEYSGMEHVPELLRDYIERYSCLYNLMKDFEKFYFRLIGVEQYQESGILRIHEINRYFIPEERSDCGRALNKAVNEMSAFVSTHRNWYTDANGVGVAGSSAPAEPLYAEVPENTPAEDRSIADLADGQASIGHLHAEPPPGLLRGNATGARPKVKKTALPQNLPPREQYRPTPDQLGMNYPHHQQRYQNGVITAAPQLRQAESRQPPGYSAQWRPGRLQPSQNSSSIREPREHSTMPDSTGSSFEIPDTEDLSSMSPTTASTKPAEATRDVQHHTPAPLKGFNSTLFNPSFHPESFQTADFASENFENNGLHPASYLPSNVTQTTSSGGPHTTFHRTPDSDILTFLPSDATQMTSLGDATQSAKLQELDSLIEGVAVRRPSNEKSPASGLFTLANIDEEELDLEDQIKSINLT